MKNDPLAKPDPNVTLSAKDRKIGGLVIFMTKKEPSLECVGRKSSSGQRDWQPAATKHDHGDEVFNIAKTISHSDRQLDFVVGRFNSCVGNTVPDG